MIIKIFVLTKDDGIVEAHGFKQHAVGVFNGGWCHYDKARVMRINCFHRLAMKGPAAGGAATGEANGDRAGDLCAPIERGGVIDDLVEARG